MTCICGIEHKGSVYIGADSAVSASNTITTCKPTEKLFSISNNKIAIGVCSSIRLMQVIHYGFEHEYKFNPQEHNDSQYLTINFIDELRSYLSEKDVLSDGNLPDDSDLLIAFNHKLWRLDANFQLFNSLNCYDAIGGGEEVALGALEILKYNETIQPEAKILRALEAASLHVQTVRPPYHIMKLSKTTVKTIKC